MTKDYSELLFVLFPSIMNQGYFDHSINQLKY